MYVAVKGGEKAIEAAHALMDAKRRGNPEIPEISVAQIMEQMRLAVDRVMAEGSLYDPELAALAIKQACGDLVEAVFLVRAYRTTLPPFRLFKPCKYRPHAGESSCLRHFQRPARRPDAWSDI